MKNELKIVGKYKVVKYKLYWGKVIGNPFKKCVDKWFKENNEK